MIECFYRGKSFDEIEKPLRGYRKKIFKEWGIKGIFESTEQRECDHPMVIRKNGFESNKMVSRR